MRTSTTLVPRVLGWAASFALSVLATDAAAQGNLTVTSPAFRNGGAIPVEFSCSGRGSSPPLHWSGLPVDTKSVAVVVDDPDAPKGPFVHWIVYDIPPGNTELSPGASAQKALPEGSAQGRNGKGELGWAPVCPPGGMHHYHFKVFALRDRLALSQPSEDDLMRAMHGRVLAQGEIVGTFEHQGR
jgi:Raf kinase inhibitor-like YbhB/YbcL family protein